MAKAKDAFRTISEVAEWLDTPTHVLRFWESKFTQIKPVKGAGGRRYYRPADMDLLGGIKQLLHEEGMTIKGTQKILREKGVKHVCSLGPSVTETAVAEKPKPKPANVTTSPTPVAEQPTPVAEQPKPTAPAPAPPQTTAEPFQDALPFDRPPEPAPQVTAPQPPAFVLDLPTLPDALPDLPARSFGVLATNQDALRAHTAQIAPLIERLQQLQARMRSR